LAKFNTTLLGGFAHWRAALLTVTATANANYR
jgi:hypothetical protein